VTLVQQLVDARIIWLERHGSANRTYITAYQAPLPNDGEPEPAAEVTEPTYDDLRASADAALAQGDTARAAQLTYQSAMLLARAANAGDTFFSPQTGAARCTDQVQAGSPAAYVNESSTPDRGTESSVCDAGDDDEDQQPAAQQRDVPNTPATRLLRRYGVQDRDTIRKYAAAALHDIERAEHRRAELGYSPGLIPKILADGGVVWTRCGQRVDNSRVLPPLDDEEGWRERYIGGPLGRYIIGGPTDAPGPIEADDAPPPEPERYRRDAEHALIDGYVPPALRPMPTPPDTPLGDDDPELAKYRNSLSVPPWMWEEGDA
jgi:hypothetical protein